MGPTQPPVLGLYLGQVGRGVGLPTYSHLAPKLQKEYSYTSTFPLGLHGSFYGEL